MTMPTDSLNVRLEKKFLSLTSLSAERTIGLVDATPANSISSPTDISVIVLCKLALRELIVESANFSKRLSGVTSMISPTVAVLMTLSMLAIVTFLVASIRITAWLFSRIMPPSLATMD